MNTPGHVVVNLLLLGKRDRPSLFGPIALGAILPDLPMLLFYAHQKMWLGISEGTIWSESYYLTGWQALFDVFNSLPFMVLAVRVAYWRKSPRIVPETARMRLNAPVLSTLPIGCSVPRQAASVNIFPTPNSKRTE